MTRIEVYDCEAMSLSEYAEAHDVSIAEIVYELVDQYLDELEL